ncbi:GIY-YIG nuclease family protein [Thiotrichales bacterium 19X7-9]|nr:GIY-YIG nuclease family protein [Thiotrichales bacterium 19X7-9]
MILEIDGICQVCSNKFQILLHNDVKLNNCPHCFKDPVHIKRYGGVVYVVNNPNQHGVKIGMTEKSIEARLKTLNNTSVVGSFNWVAIFPTDKPKKDEKRIHNSTKCKKAWISKEHYDLEPIEATLCAYRALNRKIDPIFNSQEDKSIFDMKLDQARINMQLKLRGKS